LDAESILIFGQVLY